MQNLLLEVHYNTGRQGLWQAFAGAHHKIKSFIVLHIGQPVISKESARHHTTVKYQQVPNKIVNKMHPAKPFHWFSMTFKCRKYSIFITKNCLIRSQVNRTVEVPSWKIVQDCRKWFESTELRSHQQISFKVRIASVLTALSSQVYKF